MSLKVCREVNYPARLVSASDYDCSLTSQSVAPAYAGGLCSPKVCCIGHKIQLDKVLCQVRSWNKQVVNTTMSAQQAEVSSVFSEYRAWKQSSGSQPQEKAILLDSCLESRPPVSLGSCCWRMCSVSSFTGLSVGSSCTSYAPEHSSCSSCQPCCAT